MGKSGFWLGGWPHWITGKNYYSSYKALPQHLSLGLDSEAKQGLPLIRKHWKSTALCFMGKTEAYVGLEIHFSVNQCGQSLRYVIPRRESCACGSQRWHYDLCGSLPAGNEYYGFVRNIDLAWDMGSFLLKSWEWRQAEKFSQALTR